MRIQLLNGLGLTHRIFPSRGVAGRIRHARLRPRRKASVGSGPCRPKASAGLPTAVTLALVVLALRTPLAAAQDGAASYRKPVLTVETEGHHAPVRSLIWQDKTTLISAGLDKVVKVWDLTDAPRLTRTIRPPILRGTAGIIHAAALSPWSDPKGRKLLLVGGMGVESTGGDMTVYAFPAKGGQGSGEPIARLMAPKDTNPNTLGRRNSVLTVAFDPKFLRFATAGNVTEQGASVLLWDAAALKPVTSLKGHTGAIRALAFLPDGRKLVTISEDKSMRLWDLDRSVEIGRYPGTSVLNALAVRPDGAAILVGTEAGDILQFDPANIAAPRFKMPARPEQGSVECLTYRPDGLQFVAAVKTTKADTLAVADYAGIACDVEVRDSGNGQVRWQRRLPGLVYAAAFRPDNQALAYSGGLDQAIHVQDLTRLQAAPTEIKGKGTTVLDVGFSADSRSVGFSRTLAPSAQVDGFDLATRHPVALPSNALRRSVATLDGWSFRGSIWNYTAELVKGAVVRPLDVSRIAERLWWSYTFLPPGPGHPKPAFAIGTEGGVLVYDLETGLRTRTFAGHGSPVVSLAPSPDGRWLASGSVDQTLMVYPLAGCDRLPGVGITLSAPGAVTPIAAVDPQGFAAAMGLTPFDVITAAAIARGNTRRDFKGGQGLRAFVQAADASVPTLDTNVVFVARTFPAGPLAGVVYDDTFLGTRKRNSPVLTLLIDVEHEWVVWTPQGYYDTSIEGDSRLLGWQINAPYDQPSPNDFLPIATYESTLRNPKLLDELWRVGDLNLALAATLPVAKLPVDVAFDNRPPRVAIASADPALPLPAPGKVWNVTVPEVRVKLDVTAQGDALLQSWEAWLDQRSFGLNVLAPGNTASDTLLVQLAPNRPARLTVQGKNTRGNAHMESIDILYTPPKPPPAVQRIPRQVVVAIGSDRTQVPFLPEVHSAPADARDLNGFLGLHLIPGGSETPVGVKTEDLFRFEGSAAATPKIHETFEALLTQARNKRLMPGDGVTVVIVAQGLESEDGLILALADTSGLKNPRPVIASRELSAVLGELAADYGCRVTLFLDVVHETPEKPKGDAFKQWVRELLKRQVITVIASKDGPSGQDRNKSHGIFAQGILDSFSQIGAAGGVKDRAGAYSLAQFKRAVVERVSELSSRSQDAGVYPPPTVSQSIRFAKP